MVSEWQNGLAQQQIERAMQFYIRCTNNALLITQNFSSNTLHLTSLWMTKGIVEVSWLWTWQQAQSTDLERTRRFWQLAATAGHIFPVRRHILVPATETAWSYALACLYKIWSLYSSTPLAFMEQAV